jgi:hypothetical protein
MPFLWPAAKPGISFHALAAGRVCIRALRTVSALTRVAVLALVATTAPSPAAAQSLAAVDRPLVTDTARVFPPRLGQIGVGAEFVRLPRDETLTSAPVVSLRLGLAEFAELSAAYRYLFRHAPERPDTAGTGDLFLFTKVRLLSDLADDGRPASWPAAAVRLGVKLPDASDEKRLGTNGADFSMLGLLTQRVGPVELRLSGGLQILDSPFEPRKQIDSPTFAAALLVHAPGGFVPFVEYYRQAANRAAFAFSEGRAGLRWGRGRFGFDLSASVGFDGNRPRGFAGELSRDWGVAAGVSWRFGLRGFGQVRS